MKIYLGPGGNCISAKEKGTFGSFGRINEIGLNSQEIEFVRKVYLTKKTGPAIGEKAKELGINLTTHSPYAINLCSNAKSIVENSKRMILEVLEISEIIGAKCAATHIAYYSGLKSEEAIEILKTNIGDILDKSKNLGIKNVKLGIETMAKESQFGSLDETINLCKEVKGIVPYIDWCHIFVRNKGEINYSEIFDNLEVLKLNHIYSHFSNAKYNVNLKKFVDIHVPINSHPSFELLAKEILKRKIDISIVSESPDLELDSLKMKKTFEELGYKFS
jgi:deoxyribonuclease-4